MLPATIPKGFPSKSAQARRVYMPPVRTFGSADRSANACVGGIWWPKRFAAVQALTV
jgi:hypothetical protein